MTKTLEVIHETLHDPKQLARQVDDRPKKPAKHRYERRKIREFIKLGEWSAQMNKP